MNSRLIQVMKQKAEPIMKHRKMAIMLVIAIGTICSMMPVYAADGALKPNDTFTAIAIAGLFAGAAVSSFKGWYTAPAVNNVDVPFSIKKMSGAMILAMIQVPMQSGIANLFSQIPQLESNLAVLFIIFGQAMAFGYTIDSLHSATKN